MNQISVTWPNFAWDIYPADDVEKIMELGQIGWLIPIYSREDHSHAEKIQQLVDARAKVNPPLVLWRPEAEKVCDIEAVFWAYEVMRRLADHEVRDGDHVIICNEGNLPAEGWPGNWTRYIKWLKDVLTIVRADRPHLEYHLPALSSVDNYKTGWELQAADSELMKLIDHIDVHCYPGSFKDVNEIAKVFNNARPVHVTEFNYIVPSVFVHGEAKLAASTTWYLYNGTVDKSKLFLKGTSNYTDIKSLALGEVQIPIEQIHVPSSVVQTESIAQQLSNVVKNPPDYGMTEAERDEYYAELWKNAGQVFRDNKICAEWKRIMDNGIWLGPPINRPTQTWNSRYSYQAFMGGVLTYDNKLDIVINRFPPLRDDS